MDSIFLIEKSSLSKFTFTFLPNSSFRNTGKKVPETFPRMRYWDAMEKYGSDKPDIRFDMPLVDVIDIF